MATTPHSPLDLQSPSGSQASLDLGDPQSPLGSQFSRQSSARSQASADPSSPKLGMESMESIDALPSLAVGPSSDHQLPPPDVESSSDHQLPLPSVSQSSSSLAPPLVINLTGRTPISIKRIKHFVAYALSHTYNSRNLEYYWYTPWNMILWELIGAHTCLTVSPQHVLWTPKRRAHQARGVQAEPSSVKFSKLTLSIDQVNIWRTGLAPPDLPRDALNFANAEGFSSDPVEQEVEQPSLNPFGQENEQPSFDPFEREGEQGQTEAVTPEPGIPDDTNRGVLGRLDSTNLTLFNAEQGVPDEPLNQADIANSVVANFATTLSISNSPTEARRSVVWRLCDFAIVHLGPQAKSGLHPRNLGHRISNAKPMVLIENKRYVSRDLTDQEDHDRQVAVTMMEAKGDLLLQAGLVFRTEPGISHVHAIAAVGSYWCTAKLASNGTILPEEQFVSAYLSKGHSDIIQAMFAEPAWSDVVCYGTLDSDALLQPLHDMLTSLPDIDLV